MFAFLYIWVFLLLPLSWVVWRFVPARNTPTVGVRVPFGERLRAASHSGSVTDQAVRRPLRLSVPFIVWFFVVCALARPQWIESPITEELPTRDLLLLVDLSGSMRAEDFTNASGETVDRLTAVKSVVGDFLTNRSGDRVGLVVFGDAPFLQAPFSTDLELSRQLLEETAVGMAGARTAFGDAIGLGISLFEQSDAPAKTIIALTDGNDTKSQVPPIEAAHIAKDRGIRIYTIAMGDPTTLGEEKLDEVTVQEVAKVADGAYFFAGDRDSLVGIYDELDQLETREVDVVSHRPRHDLYYWPLFCALFVSLLEKVCFILGQRKSGSAPRGVPSVEVNPATGELEVRV